MHSGSWRNQLDKLAIAGQIFRGVGRFHDLIVTSPPYADSRKKTYGVPIDEYVAWFLPITEQLHRVLSPRGSFVLNIKERVAEGERHTYVLELILVRVQAGFGRKNTSGTRRIAIPANGRIDFAMRGSRCPHFTKQRDGRDVSGCGPRADG